MTGEDISEEGFETDVSAMHDLFIGAGFETVNDPYTLDHVEERKNVIDCILVAKHGEYEVVYAEVRSNQESIAADLARSHLTPCLVITKMAGKYVFTVLDVNDRPYHARIREDGESMLREFVGMIADIPKNKWEAGQKVGDMLRSIKEFQ